MGEGRNESGKGQRPIMGALQRLPLWKAAAPLPWASLEDDVHWPLSYPYQKVRKLGRLPINSHQ